jgi:bacteriocin-like protein
MKIMNEKELNNVIGAFKTAHREKEKVHVRESLKTEIMNHIRDGIMDDERAGFLDLFQQFVWRLAPVTCVIALLLGILLSRIDTLSDYELVKLFINNPSDMSFISLYDG